MADFAKWAVAAEKGLGFKAGSFLRSYTQNRAAANDLALESSLIPEPIKLLMEGRDFWSGISAELLAELERRAPAETVRAKGFPKTPRKLSGDLRRLAPNLRRIGIDVQFPKPGGHEKRRLLEIVKVSEQPSAPSAGTDSAGLNGEGGSFGEPSATVRSEDIPSAVSDSKHDSASDAEDADGMFPTFTPDDDEEELRL